MMYEMLAWCSRVYALLQKTLIIKKLFKDTALMQVITRKTRRRVWRAITRQVMRESLKWQKPQQTDNKMRLMCVKMLSLLPTQSGVH